MRENPRGVIYIATNHLFRFSMREARRACELHNLRRQLTIFSSREISARTPVRSQLFIRASHKIISSTMKLINQQCND